MDVFRFLRNVATGQRPTGDGSVRAPSGDVISGMLRDAKTARENKKSEAYWKDFASSWWAAAKAGNIRPLDLTQERMVGQYGPDPKSSEAKAYFDALKKAAAAAKGQASTAQAIYPSMN